MKNEPNIRLRIRDLREDSDLTQTNLAEYLHCDQSLYSKYECGKRRIPVDIFLKLSAYYKVSIEYMLGLADDWYNNVV